MLLHIWLVFASQECLNTVHRLVQIQIKGSCRYAPHIPAELSAKIVQVLFHLHHTQETKEHNCKQWGYKVTIYSEPNVQKSGLNTAHWHCLIHTVWPVQLGRGEHFVFSSSTFQIDKVETDNRIEIDCACRCLCKTFLLPDELQLVKELWKWRSQYEWIFTRT